MKKIFKYFVLSIAFIVVFSFIGCAEFNIDAKITPDNFVSFTYTLDFTELDKEDPNYEQLELFLLDIQEHWEEYGVDGDIETSETEIKLIGTMKRQCSSREEAFNALYEFMTNEISVFKNVSLDYAELGYKSEYKLVFLMDMTGIVDEQIYEIHPTIVGEDVDEFMKSFKCNVSFSLPYNDSTESFEIVENINEAAIPIDSAFEYEVAGVILDNEAKQYEQGLYNLKGKLKTGIIISTVISGIALLGIIAVIIIGAKSMKRKKSGNDDEETKQTV